MPLLTDWDETIFPVKDKYDASDLIHSTTRLQAACLRADVGCSTTPEETWRWRQRGLVVEYRHRQDANKWVCVVFLDKTHTVKEGWRLAWYAHSFDDNALLDEVLAGAVERLTELLQDGTVSSQRECKGVYFAVPEISDVPHDRTFLRLAGGLAKRPKVQDTADVKDEALAGVLTPVRMVSVDFKQRIGKNPPTKGETPDDQLPHRPADRVSDTRGR